VKLLLDFFPLLLFFAAFKLHGIFAATAVAMAASAVQVGWHWWKHRRVEARHIVTAVTIGVFGTLTLVLKDPTFIKWKPTLVHWAFAAGLLGTHFLGRRTAFEMLLGGDVQLPQRAWRTLNVSWAFFFLVMGALNIYVAFYYAPDLPEEQRTSIWVNFKVFWTLGLTFAFVLLQSVLLARYFTERPEEK